MTPDAFTASLEQSAAEHPPSKARRIAALLPQIEAAMARGSPRAHIVKALQDVGVQVTAHQLSNVIALLRRQRDSAPGLPGLSTAEQARDSISGLKARTDGSPGTSPVSAVPRIASVPTPASALSGGRAASQQPRFGAHDPRLLDEVMRSTPDMKALAKLAPKHSTQGKP